MPLQKIRRDQSRRGRLPASAGLLLLVAGFLVGLPFMAGGAAAAAAAAAAEAPADLAQGHPALADSVQAGHDAAAGNDGIATTRWTAADGLTGHWWQVDLGTSTSLSGTEITWEFGRTYGYRIEVSVNGSAWTTAADRTGNTGTAQTVTDPFTATARYVRVTVTGLPASTWASFYALRVFGAVSDGGGPAPDPALRAKCTGTSPITCHYAVAPGNYDLTLVLGGSKAASTSVQAEARRQLLPLTATTAGQTVRRRLTVNVRQPEGQPTGQGGTGTPGLDLVFAGSPPLLDGIGFAAASAPKVLYLAGDSTVCDQPVTPYTGWGQILPESFGTGLSVANYADSGESSGSFLANSALFPTMQRLLKSGDVVFIQFGHNDKTTTATAFNQNLTKLVTGVRAKGAQPVLVTPPVRRLFDSSGKLTPTALHINGVGTNLPAVMRQVATAQSTPLIDLTAKSKTLVEGLGSTASQKIYLTLASDGVTDNTHFSMYGATQMANLVLQGIREKNLSVVVYLR